MTKVTILGEQPQKPKKKPIEFKKILNSELVIKTLIVGTIQKTLII